VIYLHRDVAVYCFNTQKISYYLRRDGGMNFLGIDLTPPWRDDFFEYYMMHVFIYVNEAYI